MSKKEEIIISTLALASKYGLKSLSMSQIADSVGIKKPSLYNHFNSKEELIKEMYEYIRNKSKQDIPNISLDNITKKSTYNILYDSVMNYKKIVLSEEMFKFYSVIYSERTTNNEATQIVIEETNKMINATKELFKFLKENNKLFVDDIEIISITFSMTIHSLIDYELDCKKSNQSYDENNIQKYIKWFCEQYSKG